MCGRCLSRRGLVGAAASLAVVRRAPAAEHDAVVESHMRRFWKEKLNV